MKLQVLINISRLISPNESFAALFSTSCLGEGLCREDLMPHFQGLMTLNTQQVNKDVSVQHQENKSLWRGKLQFEVIL